MDEWLIKFLSVQLLFCKTAEINSIILLVSGYSFKSLDHYDESIF